MIEYLFLRDRDAAEYVVSYLVYPQPYLSDASKCELYSIARDVNIRHSGVHLCDHLMKYNGEITMYYNGISIFNYDLHMNAPTNEGMWCYILFIDNEEHLP